MTRNTRPKTPLSGWSWSCQGKDMGNSSSPCKRPLLIFFLDNSNETGTCIWKLLFE